MAPDPPLVALPVPLPLGIVVAVRSRVIAAVTGLIEDHHLEAMVALVAEAKAEPGAQLIAGGKVRPPGREKAATVAFDQHLHAKARLPLAGLRQPDIPGRVEEQVAEEAVREFEPSLEPRL